MFIVGLLILLVGVALFYCRQKFLDYDRKLMSLSGGLAQMITQLNSMSMRTELGVSGGAGAASGAPAEGFAPQAHEPAAAANESSDADSDSDSDDEPESESAAAAVHTVQLEVAPLPGTADAEADAAAAAAGAPGFDGTHAYASYTLPEGILTGGQTIEDLTIDSDSESESDDDDDDDEDENEGKMATLAALGQPGTASAAVGLVIHETVKLDDTDFVADNRQVVNLDVGGTDIEVADIGVGDVPSHVDSAASTPPANLEQNYNKMSVASLKKLVSDRKLTSAPSKMKKQQLVELLLNQ
jgi:hypothetical protein